uniref:Uncharacterized protein n=1 Tax=Arundo donax TaxID=35708 RepID=A0A0A9BPF2_ARUDO
MSHPLLASIGSSRPLEKNSVKHLKPP